DMLPLLRPPYLEAPGEEAAYANGQEYLLGPALLVAPIVSPGSGPDRVGTQAVWFPAGRWRDWQTGEPFAGGTEAIVAAPIDRVPLFVREGVPVPLQAVGERMAAGPGAALTLRCWPGSETGRFTLYEDDGLTDDYRRGAAAVDGRPVAFARDPAAPIDRVEVPERSTREPAVVTIDAPALDDATLRRAARPASGARP